MALQVTMLRVAARQTPIPLVTVLRATARQPQAAQQAKVGRPVLEPVAPILLAQETPARQIRAAQPPQGRALVVQKLVVRQLSVLLARQPRLARFQLRRRPLLSRLLLL